MRVLSIESSCDETGAAVVEKNTTLSVLSNVIATSSKMHAESGGIIPENAAREQVKAIIPVIVKALIESEGIQLESYKEQFLKAKHILSSKIDAIAVTYGPGLIGSLLIGTETAKTLSYALNKPLIPVNHLLAHIYANFINKSVDEIKFPFIGLIVSGGHTDLLYFKTHDDYKWLGGTRDDAAGEALDKIGRVLNLSYPAGPDIEKRANTINKTDIRFKSPLINSDDYDFSFSGLKTEVIRFVQKNIDDRNNTDENTKLNEHLVNEICYATQKAVIDVLVKKTTKAAEEYNCETILIGGGVSANQTLLEKINQEARSKKQEVQILSPKKEFATDNAAMIGAYALINGKEQSWQEVSANPELYFS